MKKKSPSHSDNEIDLSALFKVIWSGKIKILLITIISFLIGIGYSYQIPKNYSNSLTIKKSKNSEFNRIVSLTNSIKSIQTYQTNEISKFNEKILNKFINELMDYEEFLLNLKNTKKVREDIENLPIENQEKILFNYISLLKIIETEIAEPKIFETNFKLKFTWDNTDEARNILQDTLNLTLKNLEKLIYEDLEQSLKLEKEIIFRNDRQRIIYLKEQSSIAKELNITNNEMFKLGPYYLRGSKAINKEIELITNREYKNFKFFEQEINSLKKEKIQWVNYNIYLLETKSLKNIKPILIKSLLIGLILSILYVYIFNIFQSQSVSKKTN